MAKKFRVWYRIGSDEDGWQCHEVEAVLIPPEWRMTPRIARAAAWTALGVTDGVIVESDDEVMYHLHPTSETKLDKGHFIRKGN